MKNKMTATIDGKTQKGYINGKLFIITDSKRSHWQVPLTSVKNLKEKR